MKITIAALLILGCVEAKYATTTRYWDCSGGSCGCGYSKNGNPVHCESNAMFKAPGGNKYGAKFYGSAAISQTLGGGDWLPSGCGRCFKLTGRANVGGHSETTVVVLKGTNYCPPQNPSCAGKDHFDIAAPGFDFPAASWSNTCDKMGMEHALRTPQTCSYWMIHSQDPNANCNCNSFQDGTLKEGCNNFKSLNWNNPSVDYQIVDCPTELKQHPPCWNDNGGTWPANKPAKCASGYGVFDAKMDAQTPIEQSEDAVLM